VERANLDNLQRAWRHLGLDEWAKKEQHRRGDSMKAQGLEAKNVLLPFSEEQLLCMKFGELHILGLSNLSQYILDVLSLSSLHLRKKEWSVLWEEQKWPPSAYWGGSALFP
jgi:hypothetical protein